MGSDFLVLLENPKWALQIWSEVIAIPSPNYTGDADSLGWLRSQFCLSGASWTIYLLSHRGLINISFDCFLDCSIKCPFFFLTKPLWVVAWAKMILFLYCVVCRQFSSKAGGAFSHCIGLSENNEFSIEEWKTKVQLLYDVSGKVLQMLYSLKCKLSLFSASTEMAKEGFVCLCALHCD